MNPVDSIFSHFGLSRTTLERLFPFSFTFDSEMNLNTVGPKLLQISPMLKSGMSFTEIFEVKMPNILINITPDDIISHKSDIFLIKLNDSPLQLKGQIQISEDRSLFLFICIPWLTDMSLLKKLALTASDFPLHDPTVDILFLIQAHHKTLSENRDLIKSMKSTMKELRQSQNRFKSRVEQERKNMATEIHDELGQVLTVMKMDLAWLHQNQKNSHFEVTDRLKKLSHLTDETIEKVRNLAHQLRPSILDDLGLAAAIKNYGTDFEKRTGLVYTVMISCDDKDIEPESATAFFRIFQESMTNIMRHAHASRVVVTLGIANGSYQLRIEDDGRGVTPSELKNSKSLGIIGMRERAMSLGGEIKIDGEPGTGTRVVVKIPRNLPTNLEEWQQ